MIDLASNQDLLDSALERMQRFSDSVKQLRVQNAELAAENEALRARPCAHCRRNRNSFWMATVVAGLWVIAFVVAIWR